MAKLVCQSGPSAGHEYPLSKDVVVLGRSSECDIQILDTMSSRQHCEVRRDGKLFTLVDHQSRNGTYLNEKKVTERPLSFGDRIRVGEVEYLLVKEPGDVELKDLLTKYEVSEKIGEGGMGIVYKATQRSMARVIALKVLSPKYASRPRFVEQFINEARAAGKLNHPNVIQVHDVGTENGIHYFSMEYVEGRTCMELLREQGSFTVAETLECVLQIAKALEYAHSQRLIHQDIKPDNIMISTANAVKLADLGISKSFDEVASDTGPRRVMGTPHYMAPEAAMAKKIDHRVDLYSLGATAYHLLTGKTPYSGTSATDVLKAHVMEPLPPLQDLNPDVPDDVVALIERLMAKDPQQRYQSATEVVEEVRRLQAGHGLGTERIASSDTMILRRLARGPAAKKEIGVGSAKRATPGGEQPTPRHPTRPRDGAATTGHRTRDGESDLDEADDPWRKPLRVAIVIGGALVALFLLRAIWPSSGTRVPPPRQSQPTQAQPVEAVTHRDPADPAPTDHTAEDRSAVQARALAEIEREIKTRGDRADLDALMKRLDGDELAKVDPSNQARKKALVEELAKQLERRRVQGVQDAFDGLARDVDGLARDHNYELALSRIGAFPGAGEPSVAQRVADLRASVERDRDAFVGGISSREKLLVQSGDVAGLKALRDSLPPALIGSPVEQAIAKDIASLQNAAQERAQDVVKQATLELGRWNLAQVETLHDQNRKGMGDSDAGKAMDQVLRDARALGAFANAIGAALRANEMRFRGDIGSFRDPDLLDADLKSLKLRTSDGGTAFPVWSSLGDDVLQALATQVLRDRARDHQAALAALKGARGARP